MIYIKNAIVLVIITLTSFQALSQNKVFDENYLKKNIINRGYSEPTFLTSDGDVNYFVVKNGWTTAIVAIHHKGLNDPILKFDYEKQNVFYLSILDLISEKKPKLYENLRGSCKIFNHVKDVVFVRNPEDHKDDPEESIVSINLWQGMSGKEDWKLAKFYKNRIHNSVSEAINNGRKLTSFSAFNNIQKKKSEKEFKIATTAKISAKLSESGVLYYPESFWKKTYSNNGGQVLKNCFNGDFNLISESDKDRFIYEFLISYYENCGKYFSNKDYVDSKYAERIHAPGSQSVDIADPYFYYTREIKIHKSLIYIFNKLDGFWRLEKDADKFYWNCHFFLENVNCESPELNQMIENVSRLALGRPSIQKNK